MRAKFALISVALLVALCDAAPASMMSSGDEMNSAEAEATHQCLLDYDMGECRVYRQRYYFDREYGDCHIFWYGGCGGNDNKVWPLVWS